MADKLRDGEPYIVPLRKEKGERALTGFMEEECCGCGLRHLTTFEVDGKVLKWKAYQLIKRGRR